MLSEDSLKEVEGNTRGEGCCDIMAQEMECFGSECVEREMMVLGQCERNDWK
jgi:hypothetical protein